MAAVALALTSSISWGLADFFGGLQSRRHPLLAVLVVTQSTGFVFALTVVAVRGQAPPAAGAWIAWAMGGSLCGMIGIAAYYRGLALGNMGVVAPISSAAAIIPLMVGLADGERPSLIQEAGIVLAVVGVVMASREEDEATGRARIATGALLAVVAAVGFGSFFVGLDRASEADTTWAILAARLASAGVLWIVALATRTKLPSDARTLRTLAPIGVLDTSANLLFALATTLGLLTVVAVLGSFYPVVTVILAHVLLHERLRPVQRIGAMGALVGAALISAG